MISKARAKGGRPRASNERRAAGARHRVDPDPLAAKIGARIRRLRKDANVTFDAFVEATRLGRGYVSELERGLVVPTVGALSRVAAALGVTIADLVLGDTDRERLFDELREQRTSVIREIRERTRGQRPRGGDGPAE
jgi:transcriptional regulator with XRE-family HTH domain